MMFDKTVLVDARQSDRLVPYEKTVIEKKAPTDESIKYYGDIKEKAYKSILDTIKINDNSFNIAATIYEDMCAGIVWCHYKLTLNGKEITGKIEVSKNKKYQDLIDDVYRDVSRSIAVEVIKALPRPSKFSSGWPGLV